VLNDEGLEPARESVLAGQMMVVVEVIDYLSWFNAAEIDVAGLGRPLQVKEPRVNIFILKPSLFCERSTQLIVAALDDVNFLIVATAIALLPGDHVDVLLLVVLFLFLLPTVHVNIVTVLDLRFLGQVNCGQWF
jgi:hypothetical protein